MLFAEVTEAVAVKAATTADTSLIISICTIVIVPIITLFITKWSESKKQASEATHAKAKIDADAMLAKAKLETDASIAKAKLDLDSKLQLLSAQHAECKENHTDLERKLEECQKMHEQSEAQHKESAEQRAEMERKIQKFEAFLAEREARLSHQTPAP